MILLLGVDRYKGAHRYKLFNLKNDIGEMTNLADKQADQVKRLDSLIEAFLDQNKDGKVTLEEFIFKRTNGIPAITKAFNGRDTNKDGIWEKSEIKK
jgi:hypothetical protein